MAIYLLKPKTHTYGEVQAAMVRADSEQQARQMLHEYVHERGYLRWDRPASPFADPDKSTCEEVLVTGEPAIVVVDVLEG